MAEWMRWIDELCLHKLVVSRYFLRQLRGAWTGDKRGLIRRDGVQCTAQGVDSFLRARHDKIK